MFSNFYKKYISGLIALIFLFNLLGAILIFPKKTEAAPATEPTQKIHTASNIAFKIGQFAHDKLIEIKEYVLDGLAWTMANVVIDQFGDAIVDWIRNGFEGSPMFLSDPEGFFRDTANQASGGIINALDMEWLCNPLGKLRLNIDFFFPGTNRVKYECTFNDIAANFENIAGRSDISDWISFNAGFHEKNIVTTFGNDYRNGGFLMWLFTAQKKNNDLGRTIQTASDAYIAASVSVGSEKFNLNMNQGFFGVRKCVEWQETYDIEAFAGASGSVAERKCLKYQTQTPGQLVQDQLKDVAGKDLSRLQIADEIDEIIGALVSTMMGWLLTGGNDGGGVLGYDKNAGYSGSNRNHYENLAQNQKIIQMKSEILTQIVSIDEWEKNYRNSLEDSVGALYGAKENLEIVLAKLKCIRATSTNDTSNAYDDSDCDGIDENIKNISLIAVNKTVSEITSDIGKTESRISDIDSKISSFNSKHGENATSTSAQVLELFDEFENKAVKAVNIEEIESLKNEYCYAYDKENKNGTICGLFGGAYLTYKTHSEKEYKELDKEAVKIEKEMENIKLKYSCILNGYTKEEGVSESECSIFELS